MARPNFIRATFEDLPDDRLVDRYGITDKMIHDVEDSLADPTNMPESSREELEQSREKLRSELAVLGVLLAERDI